MIPELHEHGGRPGPRELGKRRGGHRFDTFGQRINLLDVVRKRHGRPPAACAALLVVGIHSPQLAGKAFGRRVGVQGQVQIVAAGVGLRNGVGQGLVGVVAGKRDARGQQVGLHGVGNQVHPKLLAALG